MAIYTYLNCMKIALNIDAVLLRRAHEIAGTTSKTATIDLTLRDFVQRGSLLAALDAGAQAMAEQSGYAWPVLELPSLRYTRTFPRDRAGGRDQRAVPSLDHRKLVLVPQDRKCASAKQKAAAVIW